MSDRTSEEVLKEEQQILGKDLGNMYNTLKNNIFWLEIKWKEYKTQFENQKNIDVLNKTAPFYFYLIHQIMLDDIILHINKIVSSKGKTFKYLSIQRLPDLVKDQFKCELQGLVDNAIEKSKFTNDRRNRYIAHYSLELAINPNANPLKEIKHDDIEASIESLFQIVVFFTKNYFNSSTFRDVVYPLENANAVIRRLKMTL
jgi:hypothetical protein